ncbi:MAG: phosphoribosyl-AMP cyclohydrolase [Austwickia sp.]|jgi:phosphoribosyl-AMP cyclohydrolase|nr:phosphoribosyl-AMP cyclohydrolase [Austwickia sp.]MBK8435141.1 phosphoribosyl-AMP cyclohydrolase [Austwickia sp.]MBK9101305.1 phosphoribosyl-AMP cyclohydrolase [Austwickia sp.]
MTAQHPAFEPHGLLPAIAVDADNGEVLMLAWMNEQAYRLTLDTGRVHYWSRSRQSLWKKGESSGNMQELVDVRVDCDGDALVVRVRQTGPACHAGFRSCFYRTVQADGSLVENSTRLMTQEQMYGANP